MEGPSSTWLDRLLLTLLSYSIVLGPIAALVLATKNRLLPRFLQSSLLIQLFVYGRESPHSGSASNRVSQGNELKTINEDDEHLLNEDDEKEDTKSRRYRPPTTQESSSVLTFIWCLVGLQMSYLAWGVLQEKVMTTKYVVKPKLSGPSSSDNLTRIELISSSSSTDRAIELEETITFHDSQFLVFMNRTIAFIVAAVALVYNRPKKPRLYLNDRKLSKKPQAPLYEYIYCSLSNILSSWCQYEALKYVNFPTQVLSKSCKIIPVMLMSKLMHRKKYQLIDYLCAFTLSLGMFVFLLNQESGISAPQGQFAGANSTTTNHTRESNLNDTKLKLNELGQHIKNSSLASGLFILALYLAFDSFTSNWQQSLFNNYGISNWQMMAASNFYSILLTLVSLHQLGTLGPALKLLSRSPKLLSDCLLMSAMSATGQLFVFYTIKRFGSVLFTVMMTMRQFLAILLSCTIYGHRLTVGSSMGLLIVFLVVGFQMWLRSQRVRRLARQGRSSVV